MRDKARPSDECLFINNENESIEKSSAKTIIATFIRSHRRAITNSVKKWAKLSHTGVSTISQWASWNKSAKTKEQFDKTQQIDQRRTKQRKVAKE
jgi:hypothetical protein